MNNLLIFKLLIHNFYEKSFVRNGRNHVQNIVSRRIKEKHFLFILKYSYTSREKNVPVNGHVV